MLLTISTTHQPANDLGICCKTPGPRAGIRVVLGAVHVFYQEAGEERCTAALLLNVDPIALVRRRGGELLPHYINDRTYVPRRC